MSFEARERKERLTDRYRAVVQETQTVGVLAFENLPAAEETRILVGLLIGFVAHGLIYVHIAFCSGKIRFSRLHVCVTIVAYCTFVCMDFRYGRIVSQVHRRNHRRRQSR